MVIRNYLVPKSLDEAVNVLNQSPDNHVFAGGAWIKNTLKRIDTAIELSHLVNSTIIDYPNLIEIGAMTTLHDLESNQLLNQYFGGIIAKASQSIMGITVKNIATIGGTIAGKYSFSDLLTVLLALDVTLIFHNKGSVKLSTFLTTNYPEKDILLSISIDKNTSFGYFHKVSRTSLDFAIINVAVTYQNSRYCIVVGARPGTAAYAINAMNYINQLNQITEEELEQTCRLASDELSFSSNFRGTKEYRKTLAYVYVKRGLKAVISHVS